MQIFIFKLWVSQGGYCYGMVVIEGNVQKVFEYNLVYLFDLFNEKIVIGVFGWKNGIYDYVKFEVNMMIY